MHHANGTLLKQGECGTGSVEGAQANIFNGACDGTQNKWQVFRNPIANAFEYNSYEAASTNVNYASCIESQVALVSTECTVDGPLTANACPNTADISLPVLISNYNIFKAEIKTTRNLVDGGDTDGLIDGINTLSNGQVKNLLLSKSPYLSDKVLYNYLMSNPPNGHLKQVILANSPVSDFILNELENMNVPNGIMNQIIEAQEGESPMKDLEDQITYLNNEKLLALNDIVRIKLDSNQIDSAVYYLEMDSSIQSSCILVPMVMRKDQPKALDHIEKIREFANDPFETIKDPDRSDDLNKFCDYSEYIMPIANRPGGYYSVTNQERATLESFANSGATISTYARSILRWLDEQVGFDLAYNYMFQNSRIIEAEEGSEEIDEAGRADMLVYPNPSNGMFTVKGLSTEPYTRGKFVVVDIAGRVVTETKVSNAVFEVEVDLSGFDTGIYIGMLMLDGKIVETSKMIKN